MTPGIDERREAADRLRVMCACGCRYAEQFYELLNETVMDEWDFHGFQDVADRLADLIDPTPWQNAVEDNHRLLDRCRELERENARLKAHVRALELVGKS